MLLFCEIFAKQNTTVGQEFSILVPVCARVRARVRARFI